MHLQGGNIVVHPFLMRQLPTVQSLLKASSYVSPAVSLDVFRNREGIDVTGGRIDTVASDIGSFPS